MLVLFFICNDKERGCESSKKYLKVHRCYMIKRFIRDFSGNQYLFLFIYFLISNMIAELENRCYRCCFTTFLWSKRLKIISKFVVHKFQRHKIQIESTNRRQLHAYLRQTKRSSGIK